MSCAVTASNMALSWKKEGAGGSRGQGRGRQPVRGGTGGDPPVARQPGWAGGAILYTSE